MRAAHAGARGAAAPAGDAAAAPATAAAAATAAEDPPPWPPGQRASAARWLTRRSSPCWRGALLARQLLCVLAHAASRTAWASLARRGSSPGRAPAPALRARAAHVLDTGFGLMVQILPLLEGVSGADRLQQAAEDEVRLAHAVQRSGGDARRLLQQRQAAARGAPPGDLAALSDTLHRAWLRQRRAGDPHRLRSVVDLTRQPGHRPLLNALLQLAPHCLLMWPMQRAQPCRTADVLQWLLLAAGPAGDAPGVVLAATWCERAAAAARLCLQAVCAPRMSDLQRRQALTLRFASPRPPLHAADVAARRPKRQSTWRRWFSS